MTAILIKEVALALSATIYFVYVTKLILVFLGRGVSYARLLGGSMSTFLGDMGRMDWTGLDWIREMTFMIYL